VLQILSAQTKELSEERTWALKFPVHILFLEELLTVFPDARLVWAHRHPIPTVASLSAMMCTLHGIYYDKDTCDHHEVGRQITELTSKCLKKAMDVLQRPNVTCAHVIFNDLVQDPINEIKKIYEKFDMEYTSDFESNMRKYLEKNNAERAVLKQNVEKAGKKFDYNDPADYGLDCNGLVNGNFKLYLDKFKFPSVQ
jgi:hypothetical protein